MGTLLGTSPGSRGERGGNMTQNFGKLFLYNFLINSYFFSTFGDLKWEGRAKHLGKHTPQGNIIYSIKESHKMMDLSV